MKQILVNREELDDEHMHLAQKLLQKQFPHLDGLKSTLLSETDGFAPHASKFNDNFFVIGVK